MLTSKLQQRQVERSGISPDVGASAADRRLGAILRLPHRNGKAGHLPGSELLELAPAWPLELAARCRKPDQAEKDQEAGRGFGYDGVVG